MNEVRRRGFTLVELLVVLAIIAALLTLVVPRYFQETDKAKETVLRQNLSAMRDSIDRYRSDHGRYPKSLDELVQRRYLRDVPLDTVTGRRDTWVIDAPPPPEEGGLYDVHSGAPGLARDGTAYSTW